MEERRKTERKQTKNFFGVYHRKTEEYVGRLFDLSTRGLMILAKNEMLVNTFYDFRIDLPKPIGGKSCLMFSAECVWCKESSGKGCEAGFQIVNIDFEEIKTIQYLLNDPLFMDADEQPRITIVEQTS